MDQRKSDSHGTYFETKRTKTGKRAYGTLSPTAENLLQRYLQTIGVVIPDRLPFIRHRSGRPYTKDKLGQDFRVIRELCFPGDDRTLGDMRTSSNIESAVGGATPSQLSAKSGNSISQSNKLHDTYVPTQLANVRQADAARERGKKRLKKSKG
ncbi:MAG: hypothetical protein ACR2OW_09600 [Methyloligellaceae bacterium]